MIVKCDKCGKHYDDTYYLTYCPHEYFQMRMTWVDSNGESKVITSLEEFDEVLKKKNV